jgi:hypothetical protein
MGDNTVMLSVAKHPDAQRERPFAAAQGDMHDGFGVTPAGSSVCDHAVMLSRSEASLCPARETLRCGSG